MVRPPGSRKRALSARAPMVVPQLPNDRWSLDFVADQFIEGRRMRILVVVDDCTRECFALVPDTSISGIRVARGLDRLLAARGKPRPLSATTAPNSPATPSCVDRRAQGRMALHRTRQPNAERHRRIIHRPFA